MEQGITPEFKAKCGRVEETADVFFQGAVGVFTDAILIGSISGGGFHSISMFRGYFMD